MLSTLPVWLLGIVIVGVTVSLSVGAQWMVARRIAHADREAHNEVTGFIIAVVGVIYAVLLALVIIGVWERYESAEAIAEREAGALGDLHRLAEGLPAPGREQLRDRLRAYGHAVVDDEWPRLRYGEASARAEQALDGVWTAFAAIEPASSREVALYQTAAIQLDQLADSRRDRLLASGWTLPSVLWSALIVGAALTIGFSFLFGMKSLGFHMVMTGALAATIGLGVWVILVLNQPYAGDLGVTSESFERVLERFAAENRPGG